MDFALNSYSDGISRDMDMFPRDNQLITQTNLLQKGRENEAFKAVEPFKQSNDDNDGYNMFSVSEIANKRGYLEVRELGRGAFGVVYKVTKASNNQRIAIKVFRNGHPSLYYKEVKTVKFMKEKQDSELLEIYDIFEDPEEGVVLEFEAGLADIYTFSKFLESKQITWKEKDLLGVMALIYEQIQVLRKYNIYYYY